MSIITTLKFAQKTLENDDIYTFSFTTNLEINHKAGQHGLFLIPGLYRPHPFTLSSSPDEEFVSFSTHTGSGSAFKKKLMSLQLGATMLLVGPILNFTFVKGKSTYVLLAQGIGITPFRSMLAYARSTDMPVDTTLVHVDGKGHLFRELTEHAASSAFYPVDSEEFQTIVKQQDAISLFYISGSPRFVTATKQLLSEMNVDRRNIKTDSFLGY